MRNSPIFQMWEPRLREVQQLAQVQQLGSRLVPDFLAAQWSCPLSSLIAHPHGGARMVGRWGATRLLVLPWTQTWSPGAPSCLGVTVGEIMPVFLAIGVCEGREGGRDLLSPNND